MNTNNIYFSANHYTFKADSVAWDIFSDVVLNGGKAELDSKYKDSSSVPIYGRAYRLAQRKGVKTLVDYQLLAKETGGVYSVTPIGQKYYELFSSLLERKSRPVQTSTDLRQEIINPLLSISQGCSSVEFLYYRDLDYIESEILHLFVKESNLSLTSIHEKLAASLFHVQPGSFDYFNNGNRFRKSLTFSPHHDMADFNLHNLVCYVNLLISRRVISIDESTKNKGGNTVLCITDKGRRKIEEGLYYDSYDERGVLCRRGLYTAQGFTGDVEEESFLAYEVKEFAKKNPQAVPIQAAVYFYATGYENCDIIGSLQ